MVGEGSHIRVITNNFGQSAGLRNTVYGTVSLGDNSSITVAQTSADVEDKYDVKPEEIQQGHSGNVAGYQGYAAKKTTFGNGVSINVMGNTDTANARAYGADNTYGKLETGDNLTVTVNTKGYSQALGLSTIGHDSNNISTTEVGKNLAVNVTNDGNAYGIYNGNGNTLTGDARTSIEKNPAVTVNGKTAVGVFNTGNQSKVSLGDKATVITDGTATSYGIFNQNGASTTFNGAAKSLPGRGTLFPGLQQAWMQVLWLISQGQDVS